MSRSPLDIWRSLPAKPGGKWLFSRLAELAGGTTTEVSVPPSHRWIRKGMTVRYLKKASSERIAVATPDSAQDWATPGEHTVNVVVKDTAGDAVFDAQISLRISERK